MICRRLTRDDLAAFRALHRFAITEAPDCFVDTPDLDAARPDADVAAMLARGEGWGAFDGDRLVGKLTLETPRFPAFAHTRWVHEVYVHPDARGRGLSAVLIRVAIEYARATGALVFLLWVNCENRPAIDAYKRAGFREAGRVPQGISVNGTLVADVMMCLVGDPVPA
ncbi:MAG: GNAT family N-acetyltransferase [Alphaproteobacteria bacterium]